MTYDEALEVMEKADLIVLTDQLRELERVWAPGTDAQAEYDAIDDPEAKEKVEAMVAEGLEATLDGARKHTSKMLIRMGLGKNHRRHVRRLQKRGDTEKLGEFWLEFHRSKKAGDDE